MPLLNHPSLILQDHLGNLENFMYDQKNILYHSFNRHLGKVESRTILYEATQEFDGDIGATGKIVLVCKKVCGDLVILSNEEGFSTVQRVIPANDQEIYNVNLCLVGEDIHIFYTLAVEEDRKKYKIIHEHGREEQWMVHEIGEIQANHLLNPMVVLQQDEEIILGYYDVIEGVEQLFIQTFDGDQQSWNQSQQLTHSPTNKLYLDMLVLENTHLHITYSEFVEGNFQIRYKQYKKEENTYHKAYEQQISNPANCTHPLMVSFEKQLWIAWKEYDYIASRFTEDGGKTWKDIYLWNDSRFEDILIYKYKSCFHSAPSEHKLNYSFGKARDLTFIGFGNPENTRIIPMKNMPAKNQEVALPESQEKKSSLKDQLEVRKQEINHMKEELKSMEGIENPSAKEIKLEQVLNKIEKMEQNIQNIEQKMEEQIQATQDLQGIEKRLANVENYLMQYTRSFRPDKEF